ncbi:hypothetical protein CYMTET_54089 [Cymbomonas tetramitiformis]|uniref:Uncharacterized protein n=1 Tax=Cymbomonas tetramitiformis TaxID=36881 RepID=A0AAE0BHG9_9CHLO|nr:hypothetical protein CYMTET_54089 [Cymbomonas tetramitiformis]
MHTLALCHIFQVVADDGADAFAAAMAEYGASAVLACGRRPTSATGSIDVSAAYGFSVAGSGGGVLAELHGLTSQVQAMEEKIWVHLAHTSLLEEDAYGHCGPPTGALSAGGAVAGDMPRQVVPHMGGASVGGATTGAVARITVPTKEFPAVSI